MHALPMHGMEMKPMCNSAKPEWVFTDKWAASRKRHHWLLYRKSGGRWRAEGFYPTPELLLKALLKELLNSDPKDKSLIEHIQRCFDTAAAAADLFKEHIHSNVCPHCGKGLVPGSTTLKKDVSHAS